MLVVSGCGSHRARSDKARISRIDLSAGSFRGVAIGDPVARLTRVFGVPPPRHGRQGFGAFQPNKDLDLPGIPDADQVPPFKPEPYYGYRDATFLTLDGRIRGFFVHQAGARTREGVRVGGPLNDARRKYKRLRCFSYVDEYGRHVSCTGRVTARRYVWFGGDPIDVIYMSEQPIG